MKLNYILLPEDYQRRPRPQPGYRRLSKKAYEAFTPMSRAGRRVPGEAKVKTAMANNGKEDEDRHGTKLYRFIKKMNNNLSARSAYRSDKPTNVDAAPILGMKNDLDVSGCLSSQVPQKRPMAESDKSSTLNEQAIKRFRSNAIASSSRTRLEDMPNAVNAPDDTVEYNLTYDNSQQRFSEEHFHRHGLPPNTNLVQTHAPFALHAAHDITPLVFPGQQYWLGAGPAPGFPVHNGIEAPNYDYQLEQVAVGCAYAAMDEPMDIDPEFPTLVPNDDYADLENLAIACAYAGLDEPMDTTLDHTRGPIFDFVPQEQHVFDLPRFGAYFHPQQAQFQPPQFQTIHVQDHFVGQDQLLQHAYPTNQQFYQEEDFVMNQIFPHHPPAEANNYPAMEIYYPVAPGFDIDHGIQQYADVPVPLQPIVHEEPVDNGFMRYPPAHEEVLHVPRLVDDRVGHDEGVEFHDAGEPVQVGLGGETEERDGAGLFEELFGAGDEDEDDEDEDDNDEHVNHVGDDEVEAFLQSIGLPIPPNPSR